MAGEETPKPGRRGLILIVAAVAAVAVLTTVTWVLVSTDQNNEPPVSMPAPSSPPTFQPEMLYATIPPAPPGLSACTGEQLAVDDVQPHPSPPEGVPGGAANYTFVLSNHDGPCALSGGPDMTITSPSGEVEPLTPRVVGLAAPPNTETVSELPQVWQLEPNQQVYLRLTVSGSYCAHFSAPTLQVEFGPAGSGMPVAEIPAPQCPTLAVAGDMLDVSNWTPNVPQGPEPAQATALIDAGITAVIEAPDTVPAGSTISYTATLTNPSGADISLEPCPRYREAAGEGATVEESYEVLNCEAAPATIPAGESMSFDMRLPLPDGLQPGDMASLIWQVYPTESNIAASKDFTVTE